MKGIIFLLLSCLLAFVMFTGCGSGKEEKPVVSPPEIEWSKTFGGSGEEDGANFIQQTADGGYILAGWTLLPGVGAWDFWLVKIDSSGEEEWNKTIGGPADERAASVQETTDGGYVVVGSTDSYGLGGWDFWMVKTDDSGEEQWRKTFGGPDGDVAFSVQQTSDGGYIVAGWTMSYIAEGWDFWMVKTDDGGEREWSRIFGGAGDDGAFCVQQTSDGGYIICGGTESYGAGGEDFWIVKTDDRGGEEWNKTFGGDDDDAALSVQQTSDGGYIIAGWTKSYGAGEEDFWLVKTDDVGEEQWSRTFGGPNNDRASFVQQTADGGYVIVGATESYGAGGRDFWIVKTDDRGEEEWNETFGGADNDAALCVRQTSDGGYVIAGWTESYGAGGWDVWVIKLK